MRLSRKRNSIYMAAIELAAQDPDGRSSRKGSATKMMGYEVYDVDGKTLPDLIPHLSCATKHEMASNRELYAASFFGVSLSVPKAKGKSSSAVDECGDSDVDTRQASCYEELRFERPVDREVYQQKMYGTAFVPQRLRGWITLVVRNARFERKSTGIRFNQDRDRDEFASSLSKRYTFEKSVPRCDIPRENWQKMMRNQPGTVYLHYYNREDAERASRIFRDDDGQPLELRLELKAGAKIISSFAATRPGPQRSPPRSYSSDRPDPSPILSQNNSAHSTPSWRRERPPSSNGDGRYSKYDRGPPAQWSRGEGRYGSSLSGNKRSRGLLERRSRSRSRSKSFHGQSHGFSRHENSAGPGDVERSTPNTQQGASVNRFRSDESNKITGSAVYNDADTPTPKRARTLSPHRSPTHGQDRITRVEKLEDGITGQEDKKTKSNSEVAPSSPVVFSDGGDNQREEQRPRSPSGRWQHSNGSKTHQRRDSFSNNRRDRSRWSAKNQHTNLQPDRDLNQQGRRPSPGRGGDRYKERQDSREFGHGGHGGDRRQDFRDFGPGGRGGDRFKERRGSRDFGRGGRGDVRFTERWGSRDFGRGDTYDNSGRERHMHSDRERGGHNGRSGDINSRSR
ncbi:hypothetical protein PHMEG_000573 [Phytophthora megakarya]|uniref:Uncharacterized protein n=1 Tax=Phytophthora megakarya TaxID=4795 RepID=A0A225X3R5_9STRA|nr:hypothetical protein PHMEG_000573 [Phytophthora megakarya]